MTVTTASAARLARVSARVIRTWCRTGALKAAKSGGRWVIAVASLRDLLARLRPAARPVTTDHRRPGEVAPQRTGRAARARVGHHMSAARRRAVLDAYCARSNGSLITVAAYLRGVVGADEAFVDRFGSAFGTKASKAYQAAFGRKSVRFGIARRGLRLFRAFAYTPDETFVLDQAAHGYDRTRVLIAA